MLLAVLVAGTAAGTAACTSATKPSQDGQNPPLVLSSPLASPLIETQIATSIAVGFDKALVDAPKDAPKPAAGKASISGLAYSPGLTRGVPKTGYYLTKALGEKNRQISPILAGADEANGDIRGYTDDKGIFTMNNIEPGNYFLILAAPNDWVPFERDGNSGAPKLVELKADQQLALGVLYVPWP